MSAQSVVPAGSAGASAFPLVSALADDAARQRAAVLRRYAELLADSMPLPGHPPETVEFDAKRLAQLKQLAAALGKGPAEVEADAAAIQQLRHYRAQIARARGSAAARAAALSAVNEHDADSARILAERRREYRRLYGVYEQLGLTHRAATDSVADLNRLLDRRPDLLAHEARASDRECE